MQFNLRYHDGIFEVTTSGDASLQGFNDYVKTIFNHEEWKPGGRILSDHSELNAGPLTVDDVQEIAKLVRKNKKLFGKAKLATLVRRDLEYGMARMWDVFVETELGEVSQQLFKDRDKAISWLNNHD